MAGVPGTAMADMNPTAAVKPTAVGSAMEAAPVESTPMKATAKTEYKRWSEIAIISAVIGVGVIIWIRVVIGIGGIGGIRDHIQGGGRNIRRCLRIAACSSGVRVSGCRGRGRGRGL